MRKLLPLIVFVSGFWACESTRALVIDPKRSNAMPESDTQSKWLCCECLAMIYYNRNTTPQQHLQSLLAFHQTIGADTAQSYKTALRQLQL